MSPLNEARYGTCPLFAAVLPLRYALGPTAAIDVSAYDLPPLSGQFPALGPRHPDLAEQDLNYTSRLLRDGWLYVWESTPPKLVEYQVESAQLTQTSRAGRVIDTRTQPHLLLRAGDSAGLVWSPVRWSEPQYQAAKKDPAVRQRIMRSFVPGAAPFSGQVNAINKQIGEYSDAMRYGWSSEPETEHALNWLKVLKPMARCEQHTYAVIDDAWGVLLDLAALMRARKAGFDSYQEHHAEEWAIAGVLKSLSDNDRQLKKQLPSITRYDELSRAWKDQDTQEDRYTADMRRLAQLWVAWFNTLQVTGPSSMDTACGHFDITQPASREALELHFAAACLGPANTSTGAKAITLSLEGDAQGKPWLLWALLGLPKRLGIGEIKYLIDLSDAAHDNGASLKEGVTQLAKAFGYAESMNKAAEKLSQLAPASSMEALFLSLAPAAGLHLHQAENAASTAGRIYMAAALARSGQRIQTLGVTPRQLGEWYSDLIGTRNTLPARLNVSPVAAAVSESIPFMHLVPASTKLAPLPVNLLASADLSSAFDLKNALSKAPIKCLVTLVAGVNFVWAMDELLDKRTYQSAFSTAGAAFGIGAAGAAVFQRVAEVDWASAVKGSGKFSISSQILLVDVLGRAAGTALAQAAFLAFDVVTYGVEAFEAYQAGDFDTMAANTAVSSASLVSIVLYVRAYRAFRIARAAVMLGETAAIASGLDVVPHLGVKLLGLAVVIVGGVITRIYTKDTPLERWVKNSYFGIRKNEEWAHSYAQSMDRLYPVLFPISVEAYRLAELNPYQGQVVSTYLLLNLPGKNVELTDDMIHFTGQEVWGDTLGYHADKIQKFEWTGKDFARHSGTRVPVPAGITPYRRVYHEDGVRDLRRIEGELIYSPREGLTLPSVKIMERAWIWNTPEQPRSNAASAIKLEPDKPTGEQPMELFITDEHTEYYLALKAGGDSDRGLLTGVLGGIGGCVLVGLGLIGAMQGKFDITYMTFSIGIPLFLVPFLWETLRPLPLPILFNRHTREVYFDHDGELFHAPWDGITAVANEFQLVGTQIGAMQCASLEIRVSKFEEPGTALMISLGAPFGKSLMLQKSLWEYIRAYMNNGPYFDEHGNHSESDAFVKSQLAVRPKMSDSFKRTREQIKQAKRESGGKNYLSGHDVIKLTLGAMFYPQDRIQEFTYSIAKRRSRNHWPSIVIERLKPNGPTTRLVDLEGENAANL